MFSTDTSDRMNYSQRSKPNSALLAGAVGFDSNTGAAYVFSLE
jgi:hypothetical protein